MSPKEIANALGAELLGTFPEIVSRLSAEQRCELATYTEVAVSTVDLWAKGSLNPHPLLRKKVVDWVTRRLAN